MRVAYARLSFVSAFVLLAAVGACRQILSIDDRAVAADASGDDASGISDAGSDAPRAMVTGQCGALAYTSASCADCMDRSCCGVAQACHDDAPCAASVRCYFACDPGDSDCRGRCRSYYERQDTMLQVTACRAAKCSVECNEPCGDMDNTVSTCDQCLAANSTCCATTRACVSDVDCMRLQVCRGNCQSGSPTCAPACETKFAAASPELHAWDDCTTACGDACKGGAQWACLDKPIHGESPATSEYITFSLGIVNLLNGLPFQQVKARACSRLDSKCATAISDNVGTDDGTITLRVPVGNFGFDGYVELTGGHLPDGGSPIYPSLWYAFPPYIAGGTKGKSQFVALDDFPSVASVMGITPDDARGHLALNARDCNFNSAAGVSFTTQAADSQTKTFYFQGGLPVTEGATMTDGLNAIGGFANLPAQSVTVKAFLPLMDNKLIGTQDLGIRPKTLTVTYFVPPAAP